MEVLTQDHEYYMRAALQEALKSFDDGEVPIGAVIQKNGVIIGKGYNRMESIPDATAHAEIIAISAASSYLSSWRLNDCTIYVTLEPCMMCMGALLHSRISRIVYGASDPKAINSHFYKQEIIRSYGYYPEIISGIQSNECGSLITSFFQQIRKKS